VLTTVVNVNYQTTGGLEQVASDPDGQADASSGGGYGARLEAVRSAAKWLLAAAAGVAALLVAGLQLTGLGKLPLTSWRLYVALAAAAATLLAIGYIIKTASIVLTQEWLTLSDFTDEVAGLSRPWGRRSSASVSLQAVEDRLTNSRNELFGHAAPTLGEFHRLLQEAQASARQTNLDALARQEANERSNALRRTARDVVQAANYYYAIDLFHALRARLAWAAVVGIVGMAVFAYAVNPPEKPSPAEVRLVTIGQNAVLST
jgi:hypothetical protein